MKSDFQAKFLQNLVQSQRSQDKGFTLIELLVVIIIIGILSAIALPSFLNQANKARESEAKQYVGSMNRAQQAEYLEWSKFTTDFGNLGLGIASNTTNYVYSIGAPTGITATGTYDTAPDATAGAEVVAAGNSSYLPAAVINGGSQKTTDTLRAYIGLVDLATEQAGTLGGGTTVGILCQKTTPGAINEGFAIFDGVRSETYPTCNEPMADPLE